MILDKKDSIPFDKETSEFIECVLGTRSMNEKKPFAKEQIDHIFQEGVPHPVQVVLKRLDAMKLPINFTLGALFMFAIIPDTVGGAMVLLIDILNDYEGELVECIDIMSKYPNGFYSPQALTDRVEFLKTKPESEKFAIVYTVI